MKRTQVRFQHAHCSNPIGNAAGERGAACRVAARTSCRRIRRVGHGGRSVLPDRNKRVRGCAFKPGRICQRNDRNRYHITRNLCGSVVNAECHASTRRGLRWNVCSTSVRIHHLHCRYLRLHRICGIQTVRSRAQRVICHAGQRRFAEHHRFGVYDHKCARTSPVAGLRPQPEQGLPNSFKPVIHECPERNAGIGQRGIRARSNIIHLPFNRAGGGAAVRHGVRVRGSSPRHGFGAANFRRHRVLRVVIVHVGQRQWRAFQLFLGTQCLDNNRASRIRSRKVFQRVHKLGCPPHDVHGTVNLQEADTRLKIDAQHLRDFAGCVGPRRRIIRRLHRGSGIRV